MTTKTVERWRKLAMGMCEARKQGSAKGQPNQISSSGGHTDGRIGHGIWSGNGFGSL